MKKILFALLTCLLLASPAAANPFMQLMAGGVEAAACQMATGALLTESFDGTALCATDHSSNCTAAGKWTAGGTPTFNYAPQGTPPANAACQYSLRQQAVGYSIYDHGSNFIANNASGTFVIYLYIDSVTFAGSTHRDIVNISESTTLTWHVAKLVLAASGGEIGVRGGSYIKIQDISEDTWYKVEIFLDDTDTGNTSWVEVNGANRTSFNKLGDRNARYIAVGAIGWEEGESIDISFGGFYAD